MQTPPSGEIVIAPLRRRPPAAGRRELACSVTGPVPDPHELITVSWHPLAPSVLSSM